MSALDSDDSLPRMKKGKVLRRVVEESDEEERSNYTPKIANTNPPENAGNKITRSQKLRTNQPHLMKEYSHEQETKDESDRLFDVQNEKTYQQTAKSKRNKASSRTKSKKLSKIKPQGDTFNKVQQENQSEKNHSLSKQDTSGDQSFLKVDKKEKKVKRYLDLCTDDEGPDSPKTEKTYQYDIGKPARRKRYAGNSKKPQIKIRNRLLSGVNFQHQQQNKSQSNGELRELNSDLFELDIKSKQIIVKPKEQRGFFKTVENMKKLRTIMTTDQQINADNEQQYKKTLVLPVLKMTTDDEDIQVVLDAPQVMTGKGNELLNQTFYVQKVLNKKGSAVEQKNNRSAQKVHLQKDYAVANKFMSRQDYFRQLNAKMQSKRKVKIQSQQVKGSFNRTSLDDFEEQQELSKRYSINQPMKNKESLQQQNARKNSINTNSQSHSQLSQRSSQILKYPIVPSNKSNSIIVGKMKLALQESKTVKQPEQCASNDEKKQQRLMEQLSQKIENKKLRKIITLEETRKVNQKKSKKSIQQKKNDKDNQLRQYFIEEAEEEDDGSNNHKQAEEEEDDGQDLIDLIDNTQQEYDQQHERQARRKIMEAEAQEDDMFVKRYLNGDFNNGNKKRYSLDFLMDDNQLRKRERREQRRRLLEQKHGKGFFTEEVFESITHSEVIFDQGQKNQSYDYNEELQAPQFIIQQQHKVVPLRRQSKNIEDIFGNIEQADNRGISKLRTKVMTNRPVYSASKPKKSVISTAVQIRKTSGIYSTLNHKRS